MDPIAKLLDRMPGRNAGFIRPLHQLQLVRASTKRIVTRIVRIKGIVRIKRQSSPAGLLAFAWRPSGLV